MYAWSISRSRIVSSTVGYHSRSISSSTPAGMKHHLMIGTWYVYTQLWSWQNQEAGGICDFFQDLWMT